MQTFSVKGLIARETFRQTTTGQMIQYYFAGSVMCCYVVESRFTFSLLLTCLYIYFLNFFILVGKSLASKTDT